MSAPTVFLFDIDGTILDARGAGRRAMQAAFEAECPGCGDAMARVRFAGMTDLGIVRTALRHAEQPADDAQVHRVLDHYLQRIDAELQVDPPRVIEGARASIDAALGHPRAAVGLGTGNHVEGARAKLGAVDLWDPFAFGGFGSDAELRAHMLAVGRDRGLARLGVAAEIARVVVIGDTPRDVEAARSIGAVCLAVTTGPYAAEDLALAGAQRVVERLDDAAALDFLSG